MLYGVSEHNMVTRMGLTEETADFAAVASWYADHNIDHVNHAAARGNQFSLGLVLDPPTLSAPVWTKGSERVLRARAGSHG